MNPFLATNPKTDDLYTIQNATRSVRRDVLMTMTTTAVYDHTMKRIDNGDPLPLGTVLWFNGYWQERRRSIVVGLPNDWHSQEVVSEDGENRNSIYTASIKPHGTSNAIGYYFPIVSEVLSPDALETVLELMRVAKIRKNEQVKAQDLKRETDTQAGKDLFTRYKPASAIAAIVAILKQDECDSMTDYFASSRLNSVVLAWSDHEKDNFLEMRKAARDAGFEPVADLAHADKEAEHREKYTGGSGYYLGKRTYSGWEIRKIQLRNVRYEHFVSVDNFSDLAKGKKSTAPAVVVEPSATKTSIDQTPTTPLNGLTLIDYSEKALAVCGDTKPVKEQLKAIGGRFNAYLIHPATGEKFAGWIFSKKQCEALSHLLNG